MRNPDEVTEAGGGEDPKQKKKNKKRGRFKQNNTHISGSCCSVTRLFVNQDSFLAGKASDHSPLCDLPVLQNGVCSVTFGDVGNNHINTRNFRLAQDLRVLFNMMQTISELYSLLDVGSAAGQQPALCCFSTATPCVFQLCKSLDCM